MLLMLLMLLLLLMPAFGLPPCNLSTSAAFGARRWMLPYEQHAAHTATCHPHSNMMP
jgi:hypothetical protein